MKDLFEKLGDSIKNTCKEAMDQTQKTVDQTKYRTEVITLKNDIKKMYQKLGEEQYRKYIEGQTENINSTTCNRITAMREELDDLENKIDTVVNEQKDSLDCYKRYVRKTWNNNDGEDTSIKKDENGIKILKFCQHCDRGNAVEVTYCTHCGEKF